MEKSLGFNLAGSLAAIDRWVQDVSSSEGEENDDNDDYENGKVANIVSNDFVIEKVPMETMSKPSIPMKDKILNRDAIFQLV